MGTVYVAATDWPTASRRMNREQAKAGNLSATPSETTREPAAAAASQALLPAST